LLPNDEPAIITTKPTLIVSVLGFDGETPINENTPITGIATHSEGKKVTVNISIINSTHEIYENIDNVTYYWEYYLDIKNLENGSYTLSVYCCDGKYTSNLSKIDFKVEHPINKNAIIQIFSPENNENVTGLIFINGIIEGFTNEIENIQIIIDEQVYNPTTTLHKDIINWRLNWNTVNVDNGPTDIVIKCIYKDGHTNQESITLKVNNTNPCPSIKDFTPPDFTGEIIYQVYILDLCDIAYPGETLTFEGLVRKKFDFGAFNFLTYIEVTEKPDWVSISIPKSSIVTPPDGKKYYFYIDVTISEDAPKDYIGEISIRAVYGLERMMQFPNYIENRIQNGYTVTYYKMIQTGDWQ